MIRVGQRIRMLQDYWHQNKGREGVVSRFGISILDDYATAWVRLDGNDEDLPMPPDVYEVITPHNE